MASTTTALHLGFEFDHCYRAVVSRDARFDGMFVVGVLSTGIYCRPSCPAPVHPLPRNVAFFPTVAAAQRAGLRACRRCLPDAVPGSPAWDLRGDLAGRAVRLIADGVVDRAGVDGLAAQLAVSERHLHRVLVTRLGATPIQLARARRAQTARVLIETTAMPFAQVAFASGFASVRQFNDTVREVFARTPTELRRRSRRTRRGEQHRLVLRLGFRPPFDAAGLLAWLRARAVPGVEDATATAYRRSLRLPAGPAVVTLAPQATHVAATVTLSAPTDLTTAVERCRRLLDLDADPTAVTEVLGADPALGAPVRATPGVRVPGAVDGAELTVRTIVGQHVSVASARTRLAAVADRLGDRLPATDGGVTRLFPTMERLAGASDDDLGLPHARAEALRRVARGVAAGDLHVDAGADRDRATRALTDIAGVGPWTAAFVRMRALRDPDAFPATDRALRSGAARLGLPADAAGLERRAAAWRPWRAYAAHLLWNAANAEPEATS